MGRLGNSRPLSALQLFVYKVRDVTGREMAQSLADDAPTLATETGWANWTPFGGADTLDLAKKAVAAGSVAYANTPAEREQSRLYLSDLSTRILAENDIIASIETETDAFERKEAALEKEENFANMERLHVELAKLNSELGRKDRAAEERKTLEAKALDLKKETLEQIIKSAALLSQFQSLGKERLALLMNLHAHKRKQKTLTLTAGIVKKQVSNDLRTPALKEAIGALDKIRRIGKGTSVAVRTDWRNNPASPGAFYGAVDEALKNAPAFEGEHTAEAGAYETRDIEPMNIYTYNPVGILGVAVKCDPDKARRALEFASCLGVPLVVSMDINRDPYGDYASHAMTFERVDMGPPAKMVFRNSWKGAFQMEFPYSEETLCRISSLTALAMKTPMPGESMSEADMMSPKRQSAFERKLIEPWVSKIRENRAGKIVRVEFVPPPTPPPPIVIKRANPEPSEHQD